MRNLILFFLKYGGLFLFIIYQIICFNLIVNFNQKQQDIFLNSTNLFTGYINQKQTNFSNYFSLDEDNIKLRRENAQLLQTIINNDIKGINNTIDTIQNLYTIIPSTTCSKTMSLRNNFLTLCDGANIGLKKGMGVIDKNGLVGIIQQCTPNYAKVISLLNGQSRISVSIKNKNHHGLLLWDTYDSRFSTIHNIRKHAKFSVGDTIITSGYSMVFPPDIEVGIIESFELLSSGDLFEIKVRLNSTFEETKDVFVINHLLKEEFDTLKPVLNE